MFNEVPIFKLISQSGPVALLVILILGGLSIGVWAIIFIKFKRNKKEAAAFDLWFKKMAKAESLKDINKIAKEIKDCSLTKIARVCIKEIEGLAPYVSFASLEARTQLVEEAVERSVDHEKHVNDKKLSFLALSSSVAPFLGLFGTVWGIMHSFLEIGNQGSANITVVAPGIAEALVTTIVGLSVAIPSSAAFNFFVAFNRKSEAYMYNFSSEILSLFKRGDLSALEKSKSS